MNMEKKTMENTSSAKKPYFETSDIMERYHVGRAQALKIMREIKSLRTNDLLGSRKVLYSEVDFWEKTRGMGKES